MPFGYIWLSTFYSRGVLTVSVKARCSIEVVSVASGIFLVNFHTKWLVWNFHVHFDCAGSHKTRHLIQKSCQETSYQRLAVAQRSRPLMKILFRDLAKRPLTEIFPAALLEISYRHLARRPLIKILYRDMVKRAAIFFRYLFIRAWTGSYFEVPHRDLLRQSLIERSLSESCQETSYRDLVQRSCEDTSFGDFVQRHRIEICWDLAKTPPAEILPRGLLHTSCQEGFYGELVQRSRKGILPRDLV